MFGRIIGAVKKLWAGMKAAARPVFKRLRQPATASVVTGTLSDLPRSWGELVAENAFLWQLLALLHTAGVPLLSAGEDAAAKLARAVVVAVAGDVGGEVGGEVEADAAARATGYVVALVP